MTRARPLADDPVLLGRQKEIAALKVVGSGVDASQVGTGKCLSADTPYLSTAAACRRPRHGSVTPPDDGPSMAKASGRIRPSRSGRRASATTASWSADASARCIANGCASVGDGSC